MPKQEDDPEGIPPGVSSLEQDFSGKELIHLVNHVVLHDIDTTKSHQQSSEPTTSDEKIFLAFTLSCLEAFQTKFPEHETAPIRSSIDLVRNSLLVHKEGALDQSALQQLFSVLGRQDQHGSVMLHVRQQNAGILVHRTQDSVNFQLFELTPPDKLVIETIGRLRRTFPEKSVSLDLPTFNNVEFQMTLAATLSKMSIEGTRFLNLTSETPDPKGVTELLDIYLLANGGARQDGSFAVQKHTREDTRMISLTNKKIWRRSPVWLLLRVALHLSFHRHEHRNGLQRGTYGVLYKEFMLFVTGVILEKSLKLNISIYLLSVTRGKLCRRRQKLISYTFGGLLCFVDQVLLDANQKLEAKRNSLTAVQSLSTALQGIKSLEVDVDTHMKLDLLNDRVDKNIRRSKRMGGSVFKKPEGHLPIYKADELPTKDNGELEHTEFKLAGIEQWVEDNLNNWLESNIEWPETCDRLRELAESYWEKVVVTYMCDSNSKNPSWANQQAMSIAILTILELWVALDKTAIHALPLLQDYDPGLQSGKLLLQDLILPFYSEMKRLKKIEKYLSDRQDLSKYPTDEVLFRLGTQDCFSVRYFNVSEEHKILKKEIEQHANGLRSQLSDDLDKKRTTYRELKDECDRLQHSRCPKDCMRCQKEKQTKLLKVVPHQWPLSQSGLNGYSAVFELTIPKGFGSWRDMTVFLLLDVFGADAIQQELTSFKSRSLKDQEGLKERFKPSHHNRRIITHSTGTFAPKHKQVSGVENQEVVMIKNENEYMLYHSEKECYITGVKFGSTCSRLRTSRLATDLSQSEIHTEHLHSPNQVIASQGERPSSVSRSYYRETKLMSLGHNIRWLNLLKSLSTPVLDLKSLDSCWTILGIIYPTGPPGEGETLRVAHKLIKEEEFAMKLIKVLTKRTRMIQKNHQCLEMMGVFSAVARRVLSLSVASSVQDNCIEFMNSVKRITIDWARSLADEKDPDIRQKTTLAALVCASCFDVDQQHLTRVLSTTELGASTLIECLILIGREPNIEFLGEMPMMLAWVWRRLNYRSYRTISKVIAKDSYKCLNDSIGRLYPSFGGHRVWAISEDQDFWLEGKDEGSEQPIHVHLNLVTGQMVVDGAQVNKLPDEYTNDPLFEKLFGESKFDVVKTNSEEMPFSAEMADHTVRFGRSPKGLMIHAEKDGQKMELVPSNLLERCVPKSLIEGYIHWYCFENPGRRQGGRQVAQQGVCEAIQFRPRSSAWSQEAIAWRLVRTRRTARSRGSWQLIKEGPEEQKVISLESRTFKHFGRILSTLEKPEWIQLGLNQAEKRLDIDLPRLGLGFRLHTDDTCVKSKNHRDMVIDENQSIPTFLGLKTRLILKGQQDKSLRVVIVPRGHVGCIQANDHVSVEVDPGSVSGYHTFEINTSLRKITGANDLSSNLFLCKLHALTSFCIPDEFNGLCGTEAALFILKSASVKSFQILSSKDVDLLEQIHRLTPDRQAVGKSESDPARAIFTEWNLFLSTLTQQIDFRAEVEEIIATARQSSFLYPEGMTESLEKSKLIGMKEEHWTLCKTLQRRADIRNSAFRVMGFGAEKFSPEHDNEFRGRSVEGASQERLELAFRTARSVLLESPALCHSLPDNAVDTLRKFLCGEESILFPSGRLPLEELSWSADCANLERASTYTATNFMRLHQSITGVDGSRIGKQNLMIWLGALALSGLPPVVVRILESFCTDRTATGNINVPRALARSAFRLGEGHDPIKDQVQQAIVPIDISRAPDNHLKREAQECHVDFEMRQLETFERNVEEATRAATNVLMDEWPCASPNLSRLPHNKSRYIHLPRTQKNVSSLFAAWYDNLCVRDYLSELVRAANRQDPPIQANINQPGPERGSQTLSAGPAAVSRECIFSASTPPSWTFHDRSGVRQQNIEPCHVPREPTETEYQRTLLEQLRSEAKSTFETREVELQSKSLMALQAAENSPRLELEDTDLMCLVEACQKVVDDKYEALLRATGFFTLDATDHVHPLGFKLVPDIYQRPRQPPQFFLDMLRRENCFRLSDEWRDCILSYAISITNLQRAKRMLFLYQQGLNLDSEIQNPGHKDWNPQENPEWLLFEIDNNIMIRKSQVHIASDMISPPGGRSTVLQLQMGEGKSSVIIPMIAATLSQQECLVRVIVTKTQFKQMHRTLVASMGHLLNKKIFVLPFCRATRLKPEDADYIQSRLDECRSARGILLIQPEHAVSLMLRGIEQLATGSFDTGRRLLETQKFLDRESRDVIDESDDILSPSFELVYAMGDRRPTDNCPERWIIIQQVLGALAKTIRDFAKIRKGTVPASVIPRHRGRFPQVGSLDQGILKAIISEVVDEVLRPILASIANQGLRDSVRIFITDPNPLPGRIRDVEALLPWKKALSNRLLLLRGLFAGRLLEFCLHKKRWRVDYGLAYDRDPPRGLAVPYRAKDSPASSDHSHPDVAIILTQLCYYTGGLSDDNMLEAFKHLFQSDQADLEYADWVRDAEELPPEFGHLSNVNIDDGHRCIKLIFPSFRYSSSVVDYFLSHVVYPKEMMAFPWNLSASAWDVARKKNHPITGFSGTNGTRCLLPSTIHYHERPEQLHTDAEVVNRILKPENSVEILYTESGQRRILDALLTLVGSIDPPVRVIIDAGAQVLEMNNREFSQAWLEMVRYDAASDDDGPQAVVYFDDDDNLCVLDRKGRTERLELSPFHGQLDRCIVFLDEAHARGTDLRLPQRCRAIVTIGPNMTKDKLTQASMRMRLLGHGQHVVFGVPESVVPKIKTERSEGLEAITVLDILKWTIKEFWRASARDIEQWKNHGTRHQRHAQIVEALRHEYTDQALQSVARELQEEETQSLTSYYAPRPAIEVHKDDPIERRCQEFRNGSDETALFTTNYEAEQERELCLNIQWEQVVEIPDAEEALPHRLHDDVIEFVEKGTFVFGSRAYKPAFECFSNSSAAQIRVPERGPGGLMVTADFARTVYSRDGGTFVSDSFQRDVEWVLIGPHVGGRIKHMVVLSDFEVEELFPLIRSSEFVTLHPFRPLINPRYEDLDHLELYPVPRKTQIPIPRSLVIELNVFAGQLYFSSYDKYVETLHFLRYGWGPSVREYVVPDVEHLSQSSVKVMTKELDPSLLQYLTAIMTKVRRDCDSISKTHMGQLLDQKELKRADFEDV